MATRRSQNGWPVVTRAQLDAAPYVGVVFPQGMLRGDVATIARWHLTRYAAEVEPLAAGKCWGWADRKIEGSSQWSNHASGTAWDVNAHKHVMGKPATASMTRAQIDKCENLERASQGTLRWGAHFSRPDPMHWEIVGTPSEVASFAASLTRKVERVKITTSYPRIGQGDQDARMPGYNIIVRIQRIVGVADDGDWGPNTTAGIARWTGRPTAECKRLDEEIFRKVFGLPNA